MRPRIAGIAGLALAAALTSPALAGTVQRAPISDDFNVQHACGIIETQHVEGRQTTYFDATGTWVRDLLQLRYTSTFRSTISGRSLMASSRQNVVVDADSLTATGQGFNVKGPGGVIVKDVGRLVVAPDGTTVFATPKIIRPDDAAAGDAAEAALCDALR
jgi:hypothetical protein